MNVWTYWEGDRPPFVDLCLRTMIKACSDCELHIVTPSDLDHLLPAGFLQEQYKSLPQPALRADAIRAALLAKYGGWWWDADTVALQSPTSLPSAAAIFMTWTRQPYRVLNGYVYLCPEIAGVWLDQVNRSLRDKPSSVDWCSLGECLLTDLLPTVADAIEIPRRLFLPIDIDSDVRCFFQPGNPKRLIQDDTICFGLNYSYFMYHHRDMALLPDNCWVGSDLLIHKLLEMARKEL